MASGWPAAWVRGTLWAAAAVATGTSVLIGLAVLVAIMIGVAHRVLSDLGEIHDVEEPDSPAELLESFEQAHEDGEIDERELERVRRLLSAGGGAGGRGAPRRGTRRGDRCVAGEGPDEPRRSDARLRGSSAHAWRPAPG